MRYESRMSVSVCAAMLCMAFAASATAETTAFPSNPPGATASETVLSDMRGKMFPNISRVLVQVGNQTFGDTDVGYPSSAHVSGSVGTTSAATQFSATASTGPASFTRALTRPSVPFGRSYSPSIKVKSSN